LRVAVDTNVLAYAEGVDGPKMQKAAIQLLNRIPVGTGLLPAQVLGELFNLLVRKDGKSPSAARKIVLSWRGAFTLIETSENVVALALDLATDHQLGIWDSIVLSSAADAGCVVLLSEDLQSGFSWRGVTVVNPFAAVKHRLLNAILNPEQ
jgi:predicted nucleic acid-binding protein